jgi:hypothetical protein
MSKGRRLMPVMLLGFALTVGVLVHGQTTQTTPLSSFAPAALREWLTVISADDMEGRATFSPGLDKAAAYISNRLKQAGVKPAGDAGSYLQRVEVQTVEASNQSTLTIEVNGQSRLFKNGEGVIFPSNVGARRTFTLNGVEFVGYGLNLGRVHNDYAGRNVKGKAVLWLGLTAPVALQGTPAARLLGSRASTAIEEMSAAASLSLTTEGRQDGSAGGLSTFITAQRFDLPKAPAVTLSEEALGFLFSASGLDYSSLKARGERGEVLPVTTIKGVKLTFNLEAAYRVTATRVTQNVVGIVEGRDRLLKNTYVAYGAHYDGLGVNENIPAGAGIDRIYNGADDDGSGSSALIGLARAFVAAPKPRRSLMFAWHAGEERGLWGSEYLADHPPVPIGSIVAQLNIDMIGRNRDNLASEENTVYAVGADRISTELHNLLIDTNNRQARPLKLDFEMNDPADPERIYFRSDHFSYAAKGIPIIFFFTGLHPDYHQVTDSVEKIDFQKMSRIVRLVYDMGRRLANLDHPPLRDVKGARTGRGTGGKLQ